MKQKLILTDADGVLLDWEWAFSVWMQERGYTLTADNKKSYYLHHHYNELEEKDTKKSHQDIQRICCYRLSSCAT